VLGDTDGDGRDEIIVSASDGYLYDVQNDEFPSPAPVLDTDPPLGITDKEISTIVTESTLYGAWQAVPGALNYQIAISHEPDGIVSTPPWQDAGTATSGSITGLPLIVGQKYHFAARAIGPQGASVDAISPGVTVVAGASADAGVEGGATDAGTPVDGGGDGTTGGGPTSSGSGCGCRTASSSGDEAWLPLLGAAVVLVGRRRRRDIEPGTFTRT
jgi:MYXO-CTERM domain-containing protein